MSKTNEQFDLIINISLDVFKNKMNDYGSAWRILRLSSLTDQIFIKAQRIRNIQNNGLKKVNDNIESEFIGIINYSVMAIIQSNIGISNEPDLSFKQAISQYESVIKDAKILMNDKNHDYGEAWRDMRVTSLTDLIIQKLFRIKQIEDNNGVTLISEGVEANFFDIINYSIFSLIHLNILSNENFT